MEHSKPHFAPQAARLAVLGGIFLLMTWLKTSAAELGAGAAMPSFSLTGSSGQAVSSDGFSGKRAVVVVFMDSHCTYGQAYQSRLIALQNTYGPQGVQFVLINPNATGGNAAEMKQQAAQQSYPFPYLIDETQSTARAFGATRTPEVFVFGPDHRLVYRGQIDDNTEEKMVRKHDLKMALDAALSGNSKAIANPVTTPFGCTIKWQGATP
ncbi:MAG TPA: thioredoxin family protein [bacterium]|jgi:peroxiredoxin